MVFCVPINKCYIIVPNSHSSQQVVEEEKTKIFTQKSKNWTPPSITTKDFSDMDKKGLKIKDLILHYIPNLTHVVLSAK